MIKLWFNDFTFGHSESFISTASEARAVLVVGAGVNSPRLVSSGLRFLRPNTIPKHNTLQHLPMKTIIWTHLYLNTSCNHFEVILMCVNNQISYNKHKYHELSSLKDTLSPKPCITRGYSPISLWPKRQPLAHQAFKQQIHDPRCLMIQLQEKKIYAAVFPQLTGLTKARRCYKLLPCQCQMPLFPSLLPGLPWPLTVNSVPTRYIYIIISGLKSPIKSDFTINQWQYYKEFPGWFWASRSLSTLDAGPTWLKQRRCFISTSCASSRRNMRTFISSKTWRKPDRWRRLGKLKVFHGICFHPFHTDWCHV